MPIDSTPGTGQNRLMKPLLLFLCAGFLAILQAEPSLRQEALTLLGPVLKNSHEVPPGMTPERFYPMISQDVDFALTAQQETSPRSVTMAAR